MKKTRRSQRKKPSKVNLYYCNVNGFLSKTESIKKIVEDVNPKIICLCETKLPSGKTIKAALPTYEICSRPTKAGKSGIAIGVKLETFKSIIDVTATPNNDILVVQIGMVHKNIRVILGYAPQENEKAETREAFYTELGIEITNCVMADEIPIVIGDMNAKLVKNDNTINYISPNGKLLLHMVENHELDILNFSSKCSGKFTHVIRTTGASSVLDYALTTSELARCVESILIDEDCVICPFGTKKKKGTTSQKFSDHNPILISFCIEHQKRNTKQPKKWKITNDGLEEFFRITTHGMDKNLPGEDVQEKYNALESKINTIMQQCFRKTKSRKTNQINTQYLHTYKEITQFARKGKAQRNVAKLYTQELRKINAMTVAEREKEKVQTILCNLTVDDKFSPNAFWKLCKKNQGQAECGTSIESPDGTELFGEDLIMNAYKEEFVHRLRKREIIPELRHYEKRTEEICQLRLEEARKNKEPPYSEDEYKKVTAKLKKGKSCGRDLFPPDIFIRGGDQLHSLILTLMNQIKSADTIIHQWTLVLIATIFKNKGKRKQLVNHRGIFLKQILSKMFEKLNMNRIEKNIQQIDKFQAGNRTNRGPSDQTFLLRAAVDHCKYTKRPLYVVLYDYKQCFDSLWLSDCLLSLWKLGVQSETLNNLNNLNKECNIVVKTPLGFTNEAEVKSIVQQGSVSGGVLCSASTGEVTQQDLGAGCQVGLATIKALTFVDDIASTNTEVDSTYISHDSIVWFSKKKRIPLNIPKCMGLGVNLKTTDVLPRLKIDGQLIKWTDVAVYLGDDFNKAGTNKHLIEERVKKGRACIIAATSLCNETTMGVYTIQTLMLLYKSLFLQVVLYNSGSWSNLTKTQLLSLKTIQLKYLKRMFHAPQSTPNPLTFLETGTLPIEQVLHQRQLTFLHHILNLEEGDPVKQVYQEQLKYSAERNWGNEVKELRLKYNIVETDAEICMLTKESWKCLIKKKLQLHALEVLNTEMNELKHGGKILYEKLVPQKYLSMLQPAQARKMFHVRTGTIDLKCVRKYWYSDKICRLCEQFDESVEHVVNVCHNVPRSSHISNLFTDDIDEMKMIADRLIKFALLVKEMEESTG